MIVRHRSRATWPPWKDRRWVTLVVIAAVAALGALALWARGRADLDALARAAALLAWFALVMALIRLPPRARAPREAGAVVLRASLPRRLAMPLVIGPALALVAWRVLVDVPGPAGAAAAAAAALLVAGLLAAALRRRRVFQLRPDGLEVPAGLDGRLLRWERIRAVRVETWRRHVGLVLLGAEGEPSAGVSAWLDGTPELAAELLAHAPAEALAGPGVREALEALAGELRRAR